jgi:hypothetical protein
LADALARTVVRPLELPVGGDGARGCPLFALLLRRTLAIIAADHLVRYPERRRALDG